MRYITKRMRDKDEEEVVINDWKFAAMVIDRSTMAPENYLKSTILFRFCLFGLTLYTILTTFILLTSAPHIVVAWRWFREIYSCSREEYNFEKYIPTEVKHTLLQLRAQRETITYEDRYSIMINCNIMEFPKRIIFPALENQSWKFKNLIQQFYFLRKFDAIFYQPFKNSLLQQ